MGVDDWSELEFFVVGFLYVSIALCSATFARCCLSFIRGFFPLLTVASVNSE